MTLCLLLLISCVASLGLGLTTKMFTTRNTCVETYGISMDPSFITDSKVDCAIQCYHQSNCLSFTYRNTTLQCRLNSKRDDCPQPYCSDGLFYGETKRPVVSATNCVTSPVDPLLRLCGGSGPHEGRLEVNHEGLWGTVCDDRIGGPVLWDSRNADVVCSMFGYEYGTPYSRAYFGQGQGCIWMDEVQCDGTEESVFDCPRNQWAVHDCVHREDVGVSCYMYNITGP